MPKQHRFRTAGVVGLTAISVIAASTPIDHANAAPEPTDERVERPDRSTDYDRKAARAAAQSVVSDKRSTLRVSSLDTLTVTDRTTALGLQHVRYSVTHRGIPVIGAGVVVTTDADGKVLSTTVDHKDRVAVQNVTPRLTLAEAMKKAEASTEGKHLGEAPAARLVILHDGKSSNLAWEVTTALRTTYVDATSGKTLRTVEIAAVDGDGHTAYSGPNPRPIDLWEREPGRYYMAGTRPYLKCEVGNFYRTQTGQIAYNNKQFPSASVPSFGNADGTHLWTGCTDALYGAQRFETMITDWLGRNGTLGNGRGIPHYVGLNETNALASGDGFNVYGKDRNGRWMTSLDIVGHESGHQIDYNTSGGVSHSSTREFVADAFGAATEEFDGQSAEYDAPDMTIGEQLNIRADGQPLRTMAKMPRSCYTSIDTSSNHSAAAVGDLWFVLTAEGSGGASDALACDGSDPSIDGLGTQEVLQILYTAMLTKPANTTYPQYRALTLQAARNLYPGDCSAFTTVQQAWNAVKVPAATAEHCSA